MSPKNYLVPGVVWNRAFRELSRDARDVAFYLWTSPTRKSEGLSPFKVHYAAADLGLDTEQVVTALGELERSGFFLWDDEHEAVLDLHALRCNPLRGEDKRIPGAVTVYEQFTGSPLLEEMLKLADTHAPDLAKKMREDIPSLGPGRDVRALPSETA